MLKVDNIAWSVPSYENAADEYASDWGTPVRLGETGAGMAIGQVESPIEIPVTGTWARGCLTAQTSGTKCGYGHECTPA